MQLGIDMPDDQNNRHIIQAAGAIVWRVSRSGGKEIAIVYQPGKDGSAKRGRWTLPKKLFSQSPSRLEDDALDAGRAVTNCHSLQLGDLAGSTSCTDSNRLKVILFWNMTSADQWASPQTDDQYAWLSVRKAAKQLDCASE
jgi:hypothetical protein